MNTINKIFMQILTSGLFIIFSSSVIAEAMQADMQEQLQNLQKQWAIANYNTDKKELEKAFKELTDNAEKLVINFPEKAEPLIWQAIIVSSDAGKNGGLSALGKVKKARKLLLQAEKINSTALNASIYTSLGSLYYQVPGWPLGYGDDEQAEKYLTKALQINPDGIDSNYFYADFLLNQDRYKEAKDYFMRALKAPDRAHRALADKGRRHEAQEKLDKVNKKLAMEL